MKAVFSSAGLILAVCCLGALAQTPAAPPNLSTAPVAAKRVPAAQPSSQKQAKEPPALQKYDFGGQLQVLQDPTTMDVRKSGDALQGVPPPGSGSEIDGNVPKGFQPPTDVPLNPTALEAV